MCIGDSITSGSTTYRGGWRRHLHNLAPAIEMVGRTCFDGASYAVGMSEGYGGVGTGNHPGAPTWAFVDAFAPIDVIVLALGTNDIAASFTPAQTATNVRNLYDLLSTKATFVIACNICPRTDGFKETETNTYRANFNAEMGARRKCDPGFGMSAPDFTDGVHPTDLAYETKLAPVIYAALQATGLRLNF